MKIQLIRNATMKISYAGKTILTDPVLGRKHAFRSFAGIEKNPTVELPVSPADIIKGIDLVVISHLHEDHFDSAAKQMLPKDIPVICRRGDEQAIAQSGFPDVTPVDKKVTLGGIQIMRTPGSHTLNEKWTDLLGEITGFAFKSDNEPVVFWAGDSVLNDAVEEAVEEIQPDIILTHSCGAQIKDSGPIVMDEKMTVDICRLAPKATVIAVHMEALDHGTVTRDALRIFARNKGIEDEQLLIPDDGQILEL